jgi:hypothetical protein
MTHPAERRVFAIPIALTIKATVYVLAHDLREARSAASRLREKGLEEGLIADYVTLEPHAIRTHDNAIIHFDDLELSVIDISGTHIVSADTYQPSTHPMWTGEPRR